MDNKYANLPGIARNEPDFYETPNVPVSTTEKLDIIEDGDSSSNAIQKINISLKECRDKFNTGILNNDYTDFSDTITNRRKLGYIIEPDKFEWNQDAVEGPLQRYKRLERELAELKNDLNQVNVDKANQEPINFDPIELTKLVESLQKKINSLHLQSIGAKTDASGLDANVKKQLLIDHLNEVKVNLNKKPTADKNKKGAAPATGEPNSVVFKLFADFDQADLEKANKISSLNQRLANLEKVFGAGNATVSESQINKLCSNIENKTILGLVENLNSKISLLDSQALEQVESRLQLLSQRISQLNEKKSTIEDQEKLSRINELYTIVTGWKDVSATIPAIVDRLSSLNDIHQKAFQFSSILSRLDSEQQSVKHSVETSVDTLNQLKTNLESNLESIKASFEVINERIVSITSKS